MRVLLLSYAVIPAFAAAFGNENDATSSAGWVVGIHQGLLSRGEDVMLVSPYNSADGTDTKTNGRESYRAFPKNYKDIEKFNSKQPEIFREILREYKPDAVIIFGTEYTQGYAMLLACRDEGILDKAVIFTQGLISAIERFYVADVPEKIAHHKSLRERFNHMDIVSQRQSFITRGENEKKMLLLAKHIIGSTVWDRNVIKIINPDIEYHYCAELLRDGFYENKGTWDVNKCVRHTVLAVPSSFYPVKGIHYLLEGMKEVVRRYPDARLILTTQKPKRAKSIKEKMYSLTYENYIAELLEKYNLDGCVDFIGNINEERLIREYLKANIFVCASSIENQAQTVSEAKILGVPTVSAFVGGVTERIKHGEDGFLYQHNAPYMIAEYASRIFENDGLARKISAQGVVTASELVNKENNISGIVSICDTLCK